jgi:hypothetical protein
MGTIIDFPAKAAVRRRGSWLDVAPREGMATVVILPVIRIERHADESTGGRDPGEGAATAASRRRRRRVRS